MAVRSRINRVTGVTRGQTRAARAANARRDVRTAVQNQMATRALLASPRDQRNINRRVSQGGKGG